MFGSTKSRASDSDFGDRDVTFAFGSGQIYSSVRDLALWDRALAEHKVQGEGLLFKPNLDGYGYGWSVETTNGVEYYWHNGALSPLGFSSFMIRVPSKRRMIAYLSNLDTDLTGHLESKVAKMAVE